MSDKDAEHRKCAGAGCFCDPAQFDSAQPSIPFASLLRGQTYRTLRRSLFPLCERAPVAVCPGALNQSPAPPPELRRVLLFVAFRPLFFKSIYEKLFSFAVNELRLRLCRWFLARFRNADFQLQFHRVFRIAQAWRNFRRSHFVASFS